jgi:hypothetical protein
MNELSVPNLISLYVPCRLIWKMMAAILVGFEVVFAVTASLRWRSLPPVIQWT